LVFYEFYKINFITYVTQITTHTGDTVVIRNQQNLFKHGFSLLKPGPSSQKLTSV